MGLILNNDYFTIKSVVPYFKKQEQVGEVYVERFKISQADASRHNSISRYNEEDRVHRTLPGHYVRLVIKGELFMSDVPMERRTNEEFVTRAHGHVFIAGLGLGMVVKYLIDKKEVTKITVVECSKDVIDLVAPKFKCHKLNIIHANIYDWEPPKEKFDCMYFDIWEKISTCNLTDMRNFHKKYRKCLNKSNPNKFIMSWLYSYLLKLKRREKKEEAFFDLIGGNVLKLHNSLDKLEKNIL